MQRFEHSATVVATVINIQEAITMASLMDRLAKEFCELSHKVQEDPEDFETATKYVTLGNQLHILEELGFCTSVPGMIQYDPKYFPV